MSSEEQLISQLAEESPGAVKLAQVVSLSVLIEPQLLRRARLQLLKGVDVGAEADLWLSRLVQTRSPRGITLLPRVAERLRKDLAEKPGLFERAWRLTEEMHSACPPTVILEEKINRLSVSLDARALEEIEALLRTVANTLVHDDKRWGLANWAASALPRLPAGVRRLESAQILAGASYLRLSSHLPLDEEATGPDLPDWLSWAIPKDLPQFDLGVQLVEGGVQVGGPAPPGSAIKVPGTNPLIVELSWSEGERRRVRQVRLAKGEQRRITAPPVEIQLRTARGARYVIAPASEAESKQTADRKDDWKLCYVVMGFGKKTDFETGRTLDLDKIYRTIIKPSVEAAGLKCIRADDIIHSGPIDTAMYEQLLNADVVIADLSTSNKNAYYELGVRHGLRPYTTIIICEDSVKSFPLDISRNLILQYHHMGQDIDFDEVERFRQVLTDAIVEVYNQDPRRNDSPVYTFLSELTPPVLAEAMQGVAEAAAKSAPATGRESNGGADAEHAKLYSELMQEVDEAQRAGDFVTAKSLLSSLRWRIKAADPNKPDDPYVIRQLTLTTYKSKLPTARAALEEARALLVTLNPATSNDTETLGLWGAVHKRLWDETKEEKHLDEAIRGYERGFYLRNDYNNGINFAYTLNVRAAHAADRAEAIADFVQAQRVRAEVLSICDQWLASNPAPDDKASDEAKRQYLNNKYWVMATKAEAYLGIGKTVEAEKVYKEAYSFAPAPWVIESTKEQRAKFEPLLADSPLKYVTSGGE